MTRFSARNVSSSTVPAPSSEIWSLITDPETLATLTPLVDSIEATDEAWIWTLDRVAALGQKVDASFTERMEFTEGRRIVFSHDPPEGVKEMAGLEGVYDLTPTGDTTTDLAIDLTLSLELPLPSVSRVAVEGTLQTMMKVTGKTFATNLYERLGLDPKDVTIIEQPHR